MLKESEDHKERKANLEFEVHKERKEKKVILEFKVHKVSKDLEDLQVEVRFMILLQKILLLIWLKGLLVLTVRLKLISIKILQYPKED